MSEDSVYDFGGLKFRVLFSKWGYAPHYAEHVIDPLDGKPKLVMADPHIRHSVYIYDLVDKKIEWEFRVPGSRVPNPHIAHMITDQNPITGPYWSLVANKINASLGDIVCADGDNNLIVIDRERKNVKHVLKINGSEWLHDIIPSVNGDGLIIDDYSSGWVRKIDFNGVVKWSFPLKQASKISTVYAKASSHIESFGGNYIVVSNSNPYGVYEISDEGELLWSCPSNPPCMNATWLYHPHSAFRTGLAEANGNLTIIGLEGGGGIIAVDRDCRPRWGFMKPHTNLLRGEYRELYRPIYHGFYETTHVFPLLNGNIGAIDWRGKYSSQVVEILGLPTKTALYWLLAWDYPVSKDWILFEPLVEIGEWDLIAIQVNNNGESIIEYEIMCSLTPHVYPDEFMSFFNKLHGNRVKPGERDLFIIDKNVYSILLFRARALDKESKITVFITQKRL
ncbi:MAG: hypothetical protein QXL68_05930 [Desulfurococcaceae archaeon]